VLLLLLLLSLGEVTRGLQPRENWTLVVVASFTVVAGGGGGGGGSAAAAAAAAAAVCAVIINTRRILGRIFLEQITREQRLHVENARPVKFPVLLNDRLCSLDTKRVVNLEHRAGFFG
jgi:hypothetical protein